MLKPKPLPVSVTSTPLYRRIRRCKQCALSETRTQVVYGRGDPASPLWLVGEAPGANEDEQGLAFVGRAGRLLDMCLHRQNITACFITNVIKCRPPENRDPTEEEMLACIPWLVTQLAGHNPRVVVAMGRYSIGYFSGFSWTETRKMTVGKQVGVVRPYLGIAEDLAVMPTYHPAYLLRNAEAARGFLHQIDKARRLCDVD